MSFDALSRTHLCAADKGGTADLVDGEATSDLLDQYDDDDDGEISTAEAETVFEDEAADWLDSLLERFDTNDDGAINLSYI